MEAEAEIPPEPKPPRMNRRQWKAARGNREDKWTRKDRLLREATAEKRREQEAAEAAADAAAEAANKEDPEAAKATRYRECWIQIFSRFHGSYEDAKPKFDRFENVIMQEASLRLTGPTRSIVIIDPVYYEVELKVKGDTPCEDKLLSLLLIEDKYYPPGERCQGVHHHTYSSKLSTVEVTIGHLAQTVEATITVQVVEGSWPTHHHGRFVVRMASLSDLEMVLLDSRDGGTVPVMGDGVIGLSRCVVPVEADGELKIWVDAWQGDDRGNVVGKDQVTFVPGGAGRSEDTCDVGFCKMRVTVAWSLLVNW
ncbi:hypothetical protein ACQ4PT_045434 [Festuca glaucescens]